MVYKATLLFAFILGLASCSNSKKFIYFNDIAKLNAVDSAVNLQPVLIQNGDVLQITVATIDREISVLFNPITNNSTAIYNGNQIPQGYLVDNTGSIELPIVGKISVRGKTTSQVNDIVKNELSKTLKNIFVATRFLNFRVSVLGDVARPGSFNIQNERISLLDALSMAGDLNITAVRDDIMLIREIDGKKTYVSLNLNDSKTLSSPYFYLATNDVIYVKPGTLRIAGSNLTFQLLPTIFSAISLSIVFISTVLRD